FSDTWWARAKSSASRMPIFFDVASLSCKTVALSLKRQLLRFQFQQKVLALEPAAEARQFARGTGDAITGNDGGDRIGSACAADGTGGLRLAELVCNVAVRLHDAEGDGLEALPGATSELRPVEAHGHSEILTLALKVFGKLHHRLRKQPFFVRRFG